MRAVVALTRKLISEKEFIAKSEKYLNFEIAERDDEVSKVIVLDQVCQPEEYGSWKGQFLGEQIMFNGKRVKFLSFIKYDSEDGTIYEY